MDNESRPQTYQRTTAEDIFRRHLAPHGFTEIRGHRQALSSFVVGKGMSEWEVLTSFLDKTTGAYPRILPGGIIDIETYLKSQRRVHLSNTRPGAIRYTGYEVRYDRMAPISQVLIADENGLYSTCVRNPVAENPASPGGGISPPPRSTPTPRCETPSCGSAVPWRSISRSWWMPPPLPPSGFWIYVSLSP